MAVAAATAVIAPAAFLMSPAAYATEGPSASPEATAEATPSAESGDAENGTPENDGQSASPEASASEENKEEEKPSEEEKPATTPEAEKDGEEKKEEQKPSDDAKAEGEKEIVCQDSSVKVALNGFPNKIAAGSGWKYFTFDVENTGKEDIKDLVVWAAAGYEKELDTDGDTLREKFAHFEYKDQDNGKWVHDFADSGDNNGHFIGMFDLAADEIATIELRLKIDAGAPTGASLAVAASQHTSDAGCESGHEMYPFQIVKAGSDSDAGTAKPSDKKPSSDVKPQGEAKPIAVKGNLAETGSSSMLPTIGIAGGVAIVAGAGVVFALKRRNSGAAA